MAPRPDAPAGGKQRWLPFKARDDRARPGFDVVAARPESVVSGRRLTRGPVGPGALRGAHPPPMDLLLRVWPPMLATLASPREVDPGARLEVKYDGFRALAGLSGGRVSLQSRNGHDLAARFPRIAAALGDVVVGEAVLDGEIVAPHGGASAFQALQGASERVAYFVFDLTWLEGEDLRARPLEQRRELLESLLADAPRAIRAAEEVRGPIGEALARARREGWEGVVAKARGSTYRGTRSRDWLKVKVTASQELAIVGYTPIRTGASSVGALLLAVREGDRLVYAGKVGTGFGDALRRSLFRALEADRVDAPAVAGAPRMRAARWVRPRRVAEVAFAEWTADGKLRHPSFRRLRDDKRPEECVRESPRRAGHARGARAGGRGRPRGGGTARSRARLTSNVAAAIPAAATILPPGGGSPRATRSGWRIIRPSAPRSWRAL